VSPVRYRLGFYIPEYGVLHSHCHENLKCYIALFVLQSATVSEKMQGPGSDICSASYDGCYAINIKTEDVSDLEEEEEEDEEEEDLAPIPFLGIKAEPEVSWVSVSRLSGQPSPTVSPGK
jgi:hypothetical protein